VIIDPSRLDLAKEFKARPLGRHSPELQALLNWMRRAENCQNLILIRLGPDRWMMGERQPGGKPPHLFENQVYDSLEEAEWAGFVRRWEALTGKKLEID
jgi:hypothetical protein